MITFKGLKPNSSNGESAWNREFCKALTALNAEVFACSASLRQTPGWPDRFVHHSTFSAWVECKRVSNDLTTLQKQIIISLNQKRAGSAFVIWLDNGATYPLFLGWYSELWTDSIGHSGKWPNLNVEGLNTAKELLAVMSECQLQERKH